VSDLERRYRAYEKQEHKVKAAQYQERTIAGFFSMRRLRKLSKKYYQLANPTVQRLSELWEEMGSDLPLLQFAQTVGFVPFVNQIRDIDEAMELFEWLEGIDAEWLASQNAGFIASLVDSRYRLAHVVTLIQRRENSTLKQIANTAASFIDEHVVVNRRDIRRLLSELLPHEQGGLSGNRAGLFNLLSSKTENVFTLSQVRRVVGNEIAARLHPYINLSLRDFIAKAESRLASRFARKPRPGSSLLIFRFLSGRRSFPSRIWKGSPRFTSGTENLREARHRNAIIVTKQAKRPLPWPLSDYVTVSLSGPCSRKFRAPRSTRQREIWSGSRLQGQRSPFMAVISKCAAHNLAAISRNCRWLSSG
jgi:hypothetical protein